MKTQFAESHKNKEKSSKTWKQDNNGTIDDSKQNRTGF